MAVWGVKILTYILLVLENQNIFFKFALVD
jgi:hypothetical protein